MNTTQQTIEELREAVADAYRDEFMKPEVWREKYRLIESNHGETVCIPVSVVNSTAPCDFLGYIHGKAETVGPMIDGWLYRLSAPGYLDCTETSWADSEREALEALLADAPEPFEE